MIIFGKSVLMLPCFPVVLRASQTCSRPELKNEHRDAETLQRLETAWSIAYLKGDPDFERCLLTADFNQISASEDILLLNDELGLAEANRCKP